jgi:hypothetical protein
MTAALGTLDVLVFAGSLWLGVYLIGRDPHNSRLMLAGLGLVAYAFGWGLDLLIAAAPTVALERHLSAARWPLYSLPALLWTAVLIALVPEGRRRARLDQLWRFGCVPAAVLCYMVGIGTGLSGGGPAVPPSGIFELVLGLVVLAPMLMALGWVWTAIRSVRPRNATGILLSATLFFGLGTGLLLLPELLPRFWVLLLIGPDLVLLGVSIAMYDAFDQGEALLPEFLRSLTASAVTALLFGGQVALVMVLATGARFPLLVLLLATLTTAIAAQTFSDSVQDLVDRLVFARLPRLRQARADLRAAARTLPRVGPALDLDAADEATFTRLTRQALSHFGNLPRLAGSPLIHLPAVDRRLAEREAPDDALERAVELKALLADSIDRLKPRGQGDFGTSDEWRHYNALYFPYVAGLKPYSRRPQSNGHFPAAREALDWFSTQVPERTLYNWQTAAATLVARDLRGRGRALQTSERP